MLIRWQAKNICNGMKIKKDGEFIRYAEYEKLEQENQELQEAVNQYQKNCNRYCFVAKPPCMT